MYNAIFCMCHHHMLRSITGTLSKFPDNEESHMVERKYIELFIEGNGQSLHFSVWLSGIFVGKRLLCLIGRCVQI